MRRSKSACSKVHLQPSSSERCLVKRVVMQAPSNRQASTGAEGTRRALQRPSGAPGSRIMRRSKSVNSSAADVTDVSSRELSRKSGSSGVEGLLCAGHLAGPSRGRLGRQEACLEAVLGARRPVLSAQEEAVFGARSPRRPVWRPSWAPGGPSRAPGAPCRGRLGARPVLSARLERQDPSGGRLEHQEARLERHEPRAEAVWAPGGPF